MKTLLGSMFPSIYRKHAHTSSDETDQSGMKNVFPESTAMESADFLCFLLFLLVSLPLILVPPEHYRKPFLFTAFTSTITSFSIFIWSLARAKGGGPFINQSMGGITGVAPAKGAYLVWYVLCCWRR
jgi:NCS1 family nucleobase:cation symporter-1